MAATMNTISAMSAISCSVLALGVTMVARRCILLFYFTSASHARDVRRDAKSHLETKSSWRRWTVRVKGLIGSSPTKYGLASEAAPGLHSSRRDFSSDAAVCLGRFVTARAICLLSIQTLTLFWMTPDPAVAGARLALVAILCRPARYLHAG